MLDAQAVVEAKTGLIEDSLAHDLPEVRRDIGNMKKSRGWNNGKGDVLEVNTPPAHVDAATIKPALAVESKRARNEIMAKKFGADSLNIYVRLKGVGAFRLLASKRVRFPMDDDTPSASGQPEEREYQAIAVIGDDEVGVPSDIVGAVWHP